MWKTDISAVVDTLVAAVVALSHFQDCKTDDFRCVMVVGFIASLR
jgi:hypothetical protein